MNRSFKVKVRNRIVEYLRALFISIEVVKTNFLLHTLRLKAFSVDVRVLTFRRTILQREPEVSTVPLAKIHHNFFVESVNIEF